MQEAKKLQILQETDLFAKCVFLTPLEYLWWGSHCIQFPNAIQFTKTPKREKND